KIEREKGQKTKEAVMKGREYNKEEDGTRMSSQCPVVSCRIVLHRRRWKEVGEGEKKKPGARCKEPRALRDGEEPGPEPRKSEETDRQPP
ncbi:hypothetical protein IDF54_14150, partial [Flavobacterium sp. SaA2.13]|nr:hypothetical protein [Flavobacterium sp. SaA2.13]